MTLAIMQPYLFPYIGYWQLINTVDTFVIYDDVNFIKQGYINKNAILMNGEKKAFTLELIGASSNKLINEIMVGDRNIKTLKMTKQNYIKAPFFSAVFPIIKDILMQDEKNLAKFIGYSLEKIATYLKIDTNIIYSSDIEKNNELKAQEKIIDICKNLKADRYINAIGGQELYDRTIFQNNGIELNFLETELVEYTQFKNDFIPYLSIVDIMMFNSVENIKIMLEKYKLI